MRAVIRELFETVILALLIFLGFHLSIGNYRVEGSSMVPSLDEGEYVIVNKLVYARPPVDLLPFVGEPEDPYLFHGPRRGEVIIFEFPRDIERDFVKRVIGLPGDTVEIKRGQVIVNEVSLNEPYITHQSNGSHPKTTVPEGSYFVLGDNRRASNDSRDWGSVSESRIIGRAWVSFWPLNRWQAIGVPETWAAVPE
jgi:signal peptidase I